MFRFLLPLLGFLISWDNCRAECQPQWLQFEGKCYYILEGVAPFSENQHLCQSLDATMVSIHSTTQEDFLYHMISGGRGDVWLGAKVTSKADSFNWLDGSDRNYNLPKSRSDTCRIQGQGQCCALRLTYDNRWKFDYCDAENRQMCQKDVSPEVELPVNETSEADAADGSVTTPEKSASASCSAEEGWHEIEGKCFLVNTTKASFEQNEQFCKSIGATLASVESPEQVHFIHGLVYGGNITETSFIWLGAIRRDAHNGTYDWTDGSPVNTTDRLEEEPLCGPDEPSFPCCALALRANSSWLEMGCHNRNVQLCQTSVRPEGNSNSSSSSTGLFIVSLLPLITLIIVTSAYFATKLRKQ